MTDHRERALVGYHQFALAPVGVDPVPDTSRPWVLTQVSSDGRSVIVSTGITDGPVWLSVGEPTEEADWDAVEENELEIDGPLFYIAPVTADDFGVSQPVFSPQHPGPHKVTVYARGQGNRADQFLEVDEDPVEEYVVWIRPL